LSTIPEFHDKSVSSYLGKMSLGMTEESDLSFLSVTANHPVIAYRLATIATDMYKEQCKQIEEEESRNVVEFVDKQKSHCLGKVGRD